MRREVFLLFALVVLVHGVGATKPHQAVQEQGYAARCSSLMVRFAATQSSAHNMETRSWSKLEGAFKEYCEHNAFQTGDAIEFCRFASGHVLEVSKMQADRNAPPVASELKAKCHYVGSERWMAFEKLRITTCNHYCVARKLPPWRATNYVNTRTVPGYEDVCHSMKAITSQTSDGLGGEVLGRLFARAYALKFGMLYVYTPISRLEHVARPAARLSNTHTEKLESMESFLNFGADEVDIRTIQSNFTMEENKLSEMAKRPPICGLIGSCRLRKSCMLGTSSHDIELSMPEMRERYRRHRVQPDLPWRSGEVYAVAVHLRRGDIANPLATVNRQRAVVSEDHLLFAMDEMRKAILEAGENYGQSIVFHVFTQGENDLYRLSARNDTTLHISSDTNVNAKKGEYFVPAHASEELLLAFHSFVMADALLAGNSGLSIAASWLSKGWLWAFHAERFVSRSMPSEMTEILWNEKGEVHIPKILPPRWPRQPPHVLSLSKGLVTTS